MITFLSKRHLIFTASLAIAQLSLACNDKDETDTTEKPTSAEGCPNDAQTCPGKGWVSKATGASATIDFKDADAGAEFIIMPFATGDITKIEGGSKTALFDVTLAADPSSGAGLRFSAPKSQTTAESLYDWQALDADRRSLANRFQRDRGEAQSPGFWETARRIDRASGASLVDSDYGPTEGFYRRALESAATQPAKLTNLADITCPKAGDSVVVPEADLTPKEVDVKFGSDEQDYCYVVVSDPVTEPNQDAIKASVKAVLARFKSANFYNDTFPKVGDFMFKPFIIIADFGDSAIWPTSVDGLKGAGFYIKQLAIDTGAPTIYMAADFASVDPNQNNQDRATIGVWHATIAHEMQHAIIDYYRGRQDKKEENGFLDESIAHFYEDLFGYGQERFSFPTNFFALFASSIMPFLDASESGPAERGAGQVLLYYLTSKKGGFTKDPNGFITEGEGLKYLINIVKNSTQSGAQNLATTFGGDWVETIGNYLGALVLDGTTISGIEEKYKVQEPITGVTDLNGNNTKTFGMHFNAFGGLADRMGEYEPLSNNPKLEGQTYYQTKPIKVALTAKGQKLTVTWNGEQTGAAVTVVRIK